MFKLFVEGVDRIAKYLVEDEDALDNEDESDAVDDPNESRVGPALRYHHLEEREEKLFRGMLSNKAHKANDASS